MDIEAVIAEAQAPVDAQPRADANKEEAIEQESATPPEEAEQPWPKKAENALAKEKGKAARLKYERDQERIARQQLEQKLAQYTQKPAVQNTGEPKEADFTNYHDYIRALNKFDNEKLLADRDNKSQETQRSQQEQAWVAQREAAIAQTAQTFIKENPDAQSVIEEYADLADEFPPHVQRAFLEADNAALAFYNLAKEGKLEALASMSPARAAMEIGRAQTQAVTRQITKAPTPMTPAKGSATGSKPLHHQSADELYKWVYSNS